MEALYGRRASLLQPCTCRRQAQDSVLGRRGGWGLGVHMQVNAGTCRHMQVHALGKHSQQRACAP